MTTNTAPARTPREKAARLVAAQSTGTLVTSLRALDAQIDAVRASTDPAVRGDIGALCMTRSWVIVALEERCPEAADAVTLAFEASETALIADPDGDHRDLNYADVLIAALPV